MNYYVKEKLLMKILVLNGSPHKEGNTAALISAFKEGAESVGHVVDVINVRNKNINECLGCEYCHNVNRNVCIQKDDMQELYPMLQEMDMLVLASPIYYYNFTAALQATMTRFYAIVAKGDKFKKAKKAALILSSGSGPKGGTYLAPIAVFENCFCDYLKLENMGIITAFGDQNKSPEKLEELRLFGANL